MAHINDAVVKKSFTVFIVTVNYRQLCGLCAVMCIEKWIYVKIDNFSQDSAQATVA